MRNSLLFLALLVFGYSAFGQKYSTDVLGNSSLSKKGYLLKNRDKFSLPSDDTENTTSLLTTNLVSRTSFKKIYQRDFSAVTGTNNLPVNQIVISLNKPEIQVGQLIRVYRNSTKSIPVFGFYPFISGKLNSDDEFRLRTAQKNDPTIGYGGKIIWIPSGNSKGTGYSFNKVDPKVNLFIQKNNFLKQKLRVEYSMAELNKRISKISKSDSVIASQIQKDEKIKTIISDNIAYEMIIGTEQNIILYYQNKNSNKKDTLLFSRDEIQTIISKRIAEKGFLKSIINKDDTLEMIFDENKSLYLTPNDILILSSLSNEEINNLQEKRFALISEKITLTELLKDLSKRIKYVDDTVFEAEKDAPWTKRHFFWVSLDYANSTKTVNVFRNNIIEENQNFKNISFGFSTNYSSFTDNSAFNAFVKYEVSSTNKFLDDDALNFVLESAIVGSKYITTTAKDAYNVSGLTSSQFDEKINKSILTLGVTKLWGKEKKYGVTANYREDIDKNIANLKLGAIIPVIMNNAKTEQTNLIIEFAFPDLYSKNKDNIGKGESAFKRSYVNLKVGIPINIL